MLQGRFDDLAGQFAGFADAQASDGIAGEPDFNGAFGGFFAEGSIHAALDNAEERLSLIWIRGDGRIRPAGRAKIRSLIFWIPSFYSWPTDECVRRYAGITPRHFVLVLL